MNQKNTILLSLLALGLLVFVVFFEGKLRSPKGSRLLVFDREEVRTILITSDKEITELRKDGVGWQMVRPTQDRADAQMIMRLLGELEFIQKQNVFADADKAAKNDLKQIGLKNPSLSLKLVAQEGSLEVLLGKDAAVEGKVYAMVGGQVHVVDGSLKEQLLQKADSFRDRKLSDLDPGVVDRILIRTGAGEMELLRQRGQWEIRKPMVARADGQKVAELIVRLLRTRVESFTSESPEMTGLAEPTAAVTFFSENQPRFSLRLGKSAGDQQLYGSLVERASAYLLGKEIEALVYAKPNDLRERSLLPVEADIVDRILIEPNGEPAILLARNLEQWVCKTPSERLANAAQAKRLLDAFASSKVKEFTADVASELAKYGLATPSLKVTFSAFASENTAETKAGENLIETVLFGNSDADGVYAKLKSEPFVVKVGKELLSAVPVDPLQWADLGIYQFDPEQVVSLDVKRPEQLERFEKRETGWALASGTRTVDAVHLRSLCNTLAQLRAVRWIGPVSPEHGFSKSPTVVTFVLSNGGGSKLTISGNVDEFGYGTVEDSNLAFAISKPDLEVFKMPLLQP